MNIVASFVFTSLLLLAINYYRFLFSHRWNQWIFCSATFVLLITNFYLLDSRLLSIGLFVFVIVCGFNFSIYGALTSSFISVATVAILTPSQHWQPLVFLMMGYLAVGLLSGVYTKLLRMETIRAEAAQRQLYRQAKDLSIVRSIGTAMQSTLDLDRISHVILTAITAGHGLGFNRAMLFLLTDDGRFLQGKTAIGSLDIEEVISIWKITTREKMTLNDYIEHEEDASTANRSLIETIQKIKIAIDSDHVLARSFQSNQPMIVNEPHSSENREDWFNSTLHVSQMALIPLVNKGSAIGLILVDNHFSKHPIEIHDLERLLPLANQAAMAIQNANLYHKTQTMAITDGLTGLHNQRFFEEMLNTIYNSSRRTQMPLSMLVIDIDYFKNYNDHNGHLAGNEVLIKLAQILKQSVRKEDLTFRFGGEEFIILLSGTKKVDAAMIAEKIREKIEDTEFDFEQFQPFGQITVSIGISSFPEDTDRPRALFEAADLALYAAKRNGRNQIAEYKEGLQ
jgi:diguanylate cyclase (GGDEF)-like protein